ncbi:MAG: sodium-dependent transporter [Bacteroidota bacterium]
MSPLKRKLKRDLFSSKFGVVAAAAGSAVGLGNIWKFPYVLGESGGGAFLIIYLIFVLSIGLPLMISEFIIGRKGRTDVFGSFKNLAPKTLWPFVGYMGIGAAFLILAFYGVVAGWSLEYIIKAISNTFADKSSEQIKEAFDTFKSGIFRPILWQLIFMGLTAFIVYSGIKDGIEKYAKILMPLLVILIIILDIRAITLPNAGQGLEFLLKPDFSKLSANGVLRALGQAFFSLSLGMGALITYGSYIDNKNNLTTTAFEVTLADTLIALLAGIAIFPAVFAFGIPPTAGPELIYITLPNVFQQMPGGYIFSIMFFVLLGVAALTSSISILEVVVAYFVEELNIKRHQATFLATGLISVLGIFCGLSIGNNLDGLRPFGMNLFDLLERISSDLLLPLGGLLIAVFVGWYLGKKQVKDELSNQGTLRVKYLNLLLFILKFIAPFAIALVFMESMGMLGR